MARPPIVRSMNYELVEGATDGSVKKVNTDRADFGFDATEESRLGLFGGIGGYGINPAGREAIDYVRGYLGPY